MSESLPDWVAQEIKDAGWRYTETWKYSGYILDISAKDGRIDVQFYDRLPEGRYIATLDLPKNYPSDSLKVGEAYVFEFKVFKADLSEKLTTYLGQHYSVFLKTIYRFEFLSVEDIK